MHVTIRLAVPDDADSLPAIERSAGNSFRAIPDLAWVADDGVMSAAKHREYIARGSEWVAASDNGALLAFLTAELIERELHIWELAVREDCQRGGIGVRLIEAAIEHARRQQADALTLTTFSDVPWNAPWYLRLGFEVAADHPRLMEVLRAEAARGLPRRCAMRRAIRR